MHTCGFHWRSLVCRLSLPAAISFDLLFVWSDDDYIFCRWLTLALIENTLALAVNSFVCDAKPESFLNCLWINCSRGLVANGFFETISKIRSIFGDGQLCSSVALVTNAAIWSPPRGPYLFSYTFFLASRYVLFLLKGSSIEVLTRFAALLPPCVSYLCSWLQNDANGGLLVLLYTSWTASCARYFLWEACEYQPLWHFPSVFCAVIKALILSVFFGSQNNTD